MTRAVRPRRAAAAEATALLGRVSYFRGLPPAELRWLAARCRWRELGRGAFVFTEGEPCAGLLIVGAGAVEIRQVSSRGKEQVLHTEGPGATLGEAPLFDRGGYLASAVAVGSARVLVVPRPDLLALCQRRPRVALAILEAMARRLRRFADLAGDLALRPVVERLARHLADAAAAGRPTSEGVAFELGATQAQLAARLGTVRERVARALAQLERESLIVRTRTRVLVPDLDRLTALARGEV